MSKHQENKASLVEFLRSIKFAGEHSTATNTANQTHFAKFQQHARTREQYSSEDTQLIRSAN